MPCPAPARPRRCTARLTSFSITTPKPNARLQRRGHIHRVEAGDIRRQQDAAGRLIRRARNADDREARPPCASPCAPRACRLAASRDNLLDQTRPPRGSVGTASSANICPAGR